MVDYSKWKKIEISDDEDDTHPNIDTASLFRWRHSARLQRAEEQRKKREELEKKLHELDKIKDPTDDIIKERTELEQQMNDLNVRERVQPWNVDTISKDSWNKTVLNRACLAVDSAERKKKPTIVTKKDDGDGNGDGDGDDAKAKDQSELDDDYFSEERAAEYADFVSQYESKIKEFAFYSHFDDCRRYLLANPNLACEHTLNYLSLWCLDLHIAQKHALLEQVAKQAVMLEMLLDLAKTVGGPTGDPIDPRSCLAVFFERAKKSMTKFRQLLAEQLKEFRGRVVKAAELRIQNAIDKKLEEKMLRKGQVSNNDNEGESKDVNEDEDDNKEEQKLIGPGGLDAQEVFESLPEELQKCFESRDIAQLQEVLAKMEPSDAEYHMNRCIDAGLWVPDVNDISQGEDEALMRKILAKQNKSNDAEEDDDEDEDDEEE